MKKLFIITIMALAAFSAFPQSIVASLMEGIQNNEKRGITQMNISGKILRLAAANDPDIEPAARKMFENIEKISLLTGKSLPESAEYRLTQKLVEYEELLSMAEDGQEIRMYTHEIKNRIDEFVMFVLSEDEFMVMSITGHIDLEQIARLAGALNVNGVQHLEKLNDKNLK